MKHRSAIAATGHKFRTKNISKRVQKIVISPIKEMSILADLFQEKTGADIISFGQGIPYFDTPSLIKKGIKKALEQLDTAKYTLEPGITELRELITKDLGKRKRIENIEAKKEIMINTGCQETVACALASTIDEGNEVLLFSPSFASHIEQTIQFGGVPKFVPLIEESGWRINFQKLKSQTSKKTKVILFSNPSNPTGSVFTEKEVRQLADFAKKYDLIIITDETYDFLLYDDVKHFSPASLPDVRDRVILCSSFSKRYALTGYRVGFAFADQGIIDHMLKVHDALTICAPAISQKAAISALKSDQSSVEEFVRKLSFNRELMCQKLDELKDFFEYQKPMGAYYILVKYKFPKINSFDLALKILYEARVITIPGGAFGPTGNGHLRFSFACSPQEIEEGFKRLFKWATTFPIP
ncbi:MAG: pyridoxal phosphate-dependent aminotransferase [Candidatus Aenigmarchaeota archaeon]|nr:pyridoxal phosphate-dependent aminotransferase [Candidatus Aenigmarchaeota archaeon]